MLDPTWPLTFHRDDLEPLSIEAVSRQLRVSRAFVQLCLDAGCPTRAGKISAAEVLHWLFEYYPKVRSLSGFTAFVETRGVTCEAELRLKMANAIFTLLEFGESRTSDQEAKREFRKIRRKVELALDRV